MLDKLVDRHKNPWNQLFHLIGFIVGIYGVWNHNWTIIILSVVLLGIGHIFPHKKSKR